MEMDRLGEMFYKPLIVDGREGHGLYFFIF
jgi:hypothetical protein